MWSKIQCYPAFLFFFFSSYILTGTKSHLFFSFFPLSIYNTMANKRQKLDTNPEEKFHKGLMEAESTAIIEKEFKESKPYLHCKIDTLINDDLLRKVRKEILSNLHFTLKETDIYKVSDTAHTVRIMADLRARTCITRSIKRVIWPIWTVFPRASSSSYPAYSNLETPFTRPSSASSSPK